MGWCSSVSLAFIIVIIIIQTFFYSLHLLTAAKSKFIWAIIKLKREGVVRTLTLPPRVHNFCPQTSVNGLPSTHGTYSLLAHARARRPEKRLISSVSSRKQLLGVLGRFVNMRSFELRLSGLSWIEQDGDNRKNRNPC